MFSLFWEEYCLFFHNCKEQKKMENEELMEKVQEAIASTSVFKIREVLYGRDLSSATVSDLLCRVLAGSMNDYYTETFVAEILFWENEHAELHTNPNSLTYSKALRMAEAIIDDESEGLNERLSKSIPEIGDKVRRIRELMQKSPFVPNEKDRTGKNALHYAVILGLNTLAKGLIAIGGDVNIPSSEGHTAVAYAAKKTRKTLLEMLIVYAYEANLPYTWEEEIDDFPWDSSYKDKLMYKLGKHPLPDDKVICERTQAICNKDECQLTEDGKWVHNSRIASLFKCSLCGKYYFDNQCHQTEGYCDTCANKEHKCFLTGELLPLHELWFDNRLEVFYKKTLNPSSAVRVYHNRPELVFYQTKQETKRFFGFELELVVKSRKEEVLSSFLIDKESGEELFMNRDGSLDGHSEDNERYACGYELISHPMSLSYLQSSIKVAKAFEILQDFKSRSKKNASTGLHIHVSRDGFGGEDPDTTLFLVHKFIYADENRTFMEDLSGRKNGETRYTSFERSDVPDSIDYTGGKRYQAINYLNSKTVEFRMFKGAIGKEYLLEKIEFLDALITLAEKGNIITLEKMNKYVLAPSGRRKWPNFARFLARRSATQATFFDDLLVA